MVTLRNYGTVTVGNYGTVTVETYGKATVGVDYLSSSNAEVRTRLKVSGVICR